MPTPIELITDPISLLIIGIYALLMIWELLFPATVLPRVKNWKLMGLLSFLFYFFLSSYVPLLIDPILAEYQLLDLSEINVFVTGLLAVLFYEFLVYAWHRAMHTNHFLWRAFHQMHHSAERLDTYGAFYFSPLDMLGFTFLGSITLALFMGIPPQGVTIMVLVTSFLGMFQHANVKTPQWLGYFIQRPESHAVHHAKGIHKFNYSDLPIFDILFGTFRNPKGYNHPSGFYAGASKKIVSMLLLRDINK